MTRPSTDRSGDRGAHGETGTKRRAISSPHLHKLQRRHFILYDVLPLLGTVAAIGSIGVLRPTYVDVMLFLGMWFLTGMGLSVGFHRLFCHRAFQVGPALRVVFAICGCMAARSSAITWASQHRRHHQLADHPGDVHSPNLHGPHFGGRVRGWWYSHVGWMVRHDYPNVAHYGRDLLADRLVARVDRHYERWILLGLLLPGLVGGLLTRSWAGAFTGFMWGGVVRLFVVSQQISALNSFNHMFGTRPFKMKENNSHNIGVFGILTWGEGWHNNHHALPASANFSFRWYQLDPGYWLIKLLELLGLAWNVRRPDASLLERLRNKLESETAGDSEPLEAADDDVTL